MSEAAEWSALLSRLLPGEFSAVRLAVDCPASVLSGAESSQQTRAIELIGWLSSHTDAPAAFARLARAVARLAPRLLPELRLPFPESISRMLVRNYPTRGDVLKLLGAREQAEAPPGSLQELWDWIRAAGHLQGVMTRVKQAHPEHEAVRTWQARSWPYLPSQDVLDLRQAEGRIREALVNELGHDYAGLTEVGRGPFSLVLRAQTRGTSRVVKVVLLDTLAVSTGLVEYFQREVRLQLRELDSPHVLRVLDFGGSPSFLYAVMDDMEGGSLGRLLKHEGPAGPWLVANALRDAALGLAHAHEREIVHGNLNPRDLLFSRFPDRDEVPSDERAWRTVVGNFGFATVPREPPPGRRLREAGLWLGNPPYISPEQAQGQPARPPVDQYALGAIGYQALTGRAPYGDGTVFEIVRRQLDEQRIPLSELRPEVPRTLAAAVETMLAREPEDRFPSLLDVARELQPFASPSYLGLARASWKRLHQGGDAFFADFYQRLRARPHLDALFAGINMQRQFTALGTAIDLLLTFADDPNPGSLQRWVETHTALGLSRDDFAHFVSCFVEAARAEETRRASAPCTLARWDERYAPAWARALAPGIAHMSARCCPS